MSINSGIGERIRELRLQRGMTLRQVSEGVNLSQGFLSQVENGHATLGMNALGKIADLFGVELSTFFGRMRDPEESGTVRSFERRSMQTSSGFVRYSLTDSKRSPGLSVYI